MGEDKLVIKPRRFRISLWTLTPELEADEELDEVVSFSTSYALNQIPYAQVQPAHGINLETMAPSKIITKLDELIDTKAPVGIYVERSADPCFATTSVTNEEDMDAEKWDIMPMFIFKGYIAGSSLQKSGSSISTTLYLQHWLIDLATISMYSPRAHVGSPYQFAADLCRLRTNSVEGTLDGWDLSDTALQEETFENVRMGCLPDGTPEQRKNTMWDVLLATIRAVILQGRQQDIDNCLVGKLEEKYFEKQERALQRLVSCLEYQDYIRPALSTIIDAIVNTIDKSSAESWASTTVWDKINGVYASEFYYALAPTADWCYVIPTPGTIPDEDKIITLVQDEIVHLNYTIPTAPVLGGVVLATSTDENTDYGGVDVSNPILYPSQHKNEIELNDSVAGPIAFVRAPRYLEDIEVSAPPYEFTEIEISDVNKMTVRPKMEEARKNYNDTFVQKQIILYDLAKLEYLSKVFAGRHAYVSTGFRGDIVPGACVHLKIIPSLKLTEADKDIDLYGTVENVTVSMSSGNATTEFSLTNIRNQKEFEHNIYNPDAIPFYKEQFTGKAATLFCPALLPITP